MNECMFEVDVEMTAAEGGPVPGICIAWGVVRCVGDLMVNNGSQRRITDLYIRLTMGRRRRWEWLDV